MRLSESSSTSRSGPSESTSEVTTGCLAWKADGTVQAVRTTGLTMAASSALLAASVSAAPCASAASTTTQRQPCPVTTAEAAASAAAAVSAAKVIGSLRRVAAAEPDHGRLRQGPGPDPRILRPAAAQLPRLLLRHLSRPGLRDADPVEGPPFRAGQQRGPEAGLVANLEQDSAFERSERVWWAWLARHDSAHRLGKTEKGVKNDTCEDRLIAAYLADGTLPARAKGMPRDATCQPVPEPTPAALASPAA
jgi:hypothetical protein